MAVTCILVVSHSKISTLLYFPFLQCRIDTRFVSSFSPRLTFISLSRNSRNPPIRSRLLFLCLLFKPFFHQFYFFNNKSRKHAWVAILLINNFLSLFRNEQTPWYSVLDSVLQLDPLITIQNQEEVEGSFPCLLLRLNRFVLFFFSFASVVPCSVALLLSLRSLIARII